MKLFDRPALPESKHVLAQPGYSLEQIHADLAGLLKFMIPTYVFYAPKNISELFQNFTKFFPIAANARVLPSGIGAMEGYGGIYMMAFQSSETSVIVIMHEKRSHADRFIENVDEAGRGDIEMSVVANGKVPATVLEVLENGDPVFLWDIPGSGFTRPDLRQ